MSYIVASITPRIRARLNDQGDSLFHDTTLLPFVQDATDMLQMELERCGILAIQKKTSSPITIPKNTTSITYTSTPALPSDMLEPERVDERLAGSTDLFSPLTPRQWTPQILPTDSLRYWDYREESIFFVGATTDREILIYYLKRMFNITSPADTISLNNSQLFIICMTASLAAMDIGENQTRAQQLASEADIHLAKLTSIGVKNKQRVRTRRRPFRLIGKRI